MSAFHRLPTIDRSIMIFGMADPFRTFAIRERIAYVAGLCLLIAFASVVSYLWVRPYATEGRIVRADVVRVGMYSVSGSMGGDLPILTVRLPDGSIREVTSSWAAVNDCMPARRILLLQHGTSLQIGPPGCKKSH